MLYCLYHKISKGGFLHAGHIMLTGYLGQLDVRWFRQLQQSRGLNNAVMYC